MQSIHRIIGASGHLKAKISEHLRSSAAKVVAALVLNHKSKIINYKS